MKRIICCFLVFIYLFSFSSCGYKNEPAEVPINYYYRVPETEFGEQATLIVPEIREAKGHKQDYRYLIEQYLNGPQTYDCISPFPGGTTLEELDADTSKVYIVLSPHIGTLSGHELMLAFACLTKTVLEMTGAHTIQISTSSGTLNGKDSITFTADSFSYLEAE